MHTIDLRSDTLTKPTPAMREAMYRAEVGDDVYGEDVTVNLLEKRAAEIFGKAAALYVTSGTQGNLLALLSHGKRGDEIIMEAESHIFMYEVGGVSALGGMLPRLVPGIRGILSAASVEANIRGENIHYPPTGLICLENTHNRAGGTVYCMETTDAIAEVAKKHNLPLHLDGARVFNAAVALGLDVATVTASFDSVSVCLSKGLGAPVGSVLVGSKALIDKARKYRKMVGGGMRQAGIIAAAALIAIEEMPKRLHEDHANAALLAHGLAKLGFAIDMTTVQTNIIITDTRPLALTAEEVVNLLKDNGILVGAMGEYKVRFVTHFDVTREDMDETLRRIAAAL
jgi:threonine aldolase